MSKGLVHVYTGDGKGKTTAAMGLSVRACGTGRKVIIVQFLKSNPTGELASLKSLHPGIQVFRFESPKGFTWELNREELALLSREVSEAFDFVCKVMKSGECDLLILDEIMAAMSGGFIQKEDLVKAIQEKATHLEVVMTGRNPPEEVLALADYVTEMKLRKHPFQQGIPAREGIEF